MFREAGFNQVKHWYQFTNPILRTGEEFLNRFPSFETLDEGLRAAIRSTYDDMSGKNTTDMRYFEVMIILAFKE